MFQFELNAFDAQIKEGEFERIGKPSLIEADDNNIELGRAGFIEPVSQIIGVLSLAMVAYRIVDHWLSDSEQGVQIDMREKPPRISRIAGVPAGFVHLIDKDGNSKIEKYEYDKSNMLKDVLVKFLEKNGSEG